MKIERLSKFFNGAQEEFADSRYELKDIFQAGFIYGLAEKVYIGACAAAMIRSNPTDKTWIILYNMAQMFGLHLWDLKRTDFYECWLFKYEFHMDLLAKNPNDNVIRGMLCGYNPEGIEPDMELK